MRVVGSRALFFVCLLGLFGSRMGAASGFADEHYLGDRLLSVNESQLIMVGTVQQQILRNSPKPPHSALRLASAFVSSGLKHGVDPRLLAAIGFVESRYFVGAVNKRSNDWGLMQVNSYNIKAMKLSKRRLLTDVEYSIDSGARILAYFQKRYKKSEPNTWMCRYNIGSRAKKGVLLRLCNRYNSKLRQAL
jgi:soluble lytic murein transglycosylase-like protein